MTQAQMTTCGNTLPPEICVLRYALERHAQQRSRDVYAVFEDGSRWTYEETLGIAQSTGAALQRLGASQHEPVLALLPNGAMGVRCLLAVNYIGAVWVPANPAYKGRLLEHVLANSGARLAIVHPALLDELARVDRAALRTVVVVGSVPPAAAAQLPGIGVLPATALDGEPGALLPLAEPIEPWHTQSIIYTSGTTGPSKGVLSSYMHSYSATGPEAWDVVRDDDRHLVHMPLFHIGGSFMCYLAVYRGGSVAVVSGFRTDSFWDTVSRLGVTSAFLLGSMATFLLKAPIHPMERSHRLRFVYIVPLGSAGAAFRERFGTDVYTLFNMTEISTPLRSSANPAKPNVCGRPRTGVEVRIVDAHDCKVAAGQVGELVIRTDRPWAMNHGYYGNAAATAEAWRNGWFHTGDAFTVDSDGDYFFVDRFKDMIRRRGENISAYELEVEALTHPALREAAAVPVPSSGGEDDVLLAIVLQPGASLDPAALLAYLDERVARFMLPRYVRRVDELPKTPTAKVQKAHLKREGVTADTWDREAAGLPYKSIRLN